MSLDPRFLTPEDQELDLLKKKIRKVEKMLADDAVSQAEKKTLARKLKSYHQRLPTAEAVAKAARGRRPSPKDVRNRRLSGMLHSVRRANSIGSVGSARSARSTRSAATKASIMDAMDNFMKDEAVDVIEQRSAAAKAARKEKLEREKRLDEEAKARKLADKRARKEAEEKRLAAEAKAKEEAEADAKRLADAIKAREEAEAKAAKAAEARRLAEEEEKQEAEKKRLEEVANMANGKKKKRASSVVGKKKKELGDKKGKIKRKKKGANLASTSDEDDGTADTEPLGNSESSADIGEEGETKKKKGRSRSLSVGRRESKKANAKKRASVSVAPSRTVSDGVRPTRKMRNSEFAGLKASNSTIEEEEEKPLKKKRRSRSLSVSKKASGKSKKRASSIATPNRKSISPMTGTEDDIEAKPIRKMKKGELAERGRSGKSNKRESKAAKRESKMAKRQSKIAKRESKIAKRQSKIAKRESASQPENSNKSAKRKIKLMKKQASVGSLGSLGEETRMIIKKGPPKAPNQVMQRLAEQSAQKYLPPQRRGSQDSTSSASDDGTVKETVIDAKMSFRLPQKGVTPKKSKKAGPDYLDENFVPRTFQERKLMLAARAQKEAEDEQDTHRQHVIAAKLQAKEELERKKAEALAKLRAQQAARDKKEKVKEKILRADSSDDDADDFFDEVKNMNAQLMQRAEEFKASLEEQERKGMIILKPRASTIGRPVPKRPPPRTLSSSSSSSDSSHSF